MARSFLKHRDYFTFIFVKGSNYSSTLLIAIYDANYLTTVEEERNISFRRFGNSRWSDIWIMWL